MYTKGATFIDIRYFLDNGDPVVWGLFKNNENFCWKKLNYELQEKFKKIVVDYKIRVDNFLYY